MRVLVTSHPGLGHLNGLIALGRALAARGHPVLGAGAPSVARAFRAAGLAGDAVVAEPAWSDSARAHAEVPGLLATRAADRLGVVHAELGIRRRAFDLLPALDTLVRDWRPDLLLRDATEFAGWMVAERAGLPQVPFEVSVHWPEERWDAQVGDALRDLRARAGLDPDTDRPAKGMYRDLHLNNAPAALRDPAVALPPTSLDTAPEFFEQYGREAPPSPAGGHAYVAFGSVYAPPPEVLQPAVRELAARLPQVVLAGVLGRAFAPQTPCMPGCAVVVCHGGRNTVLTALRHGVPVVCAPIGSDHFDVADLVERAGAGLTCGWACDELVEAALRVAGDARFADAARAVAEEIAAMPGGGETAQVLQDRFG